MIILQNTTTLLQIKLGSSVTTNQLPFSSSYVDTTTNTFSPEQVSGVTNDTSTVTLVSAPAASTKRTIKYISIYNNDTVSAVITIQLSDNTVERILGKYTLSSGDRLEFTDTVGWRVLNSSGAIKQSTSIGTDTIPASQVTTNSSNRFISDTQLSNFQSGYNNAILLNGGTTVAVTFATSKYYGSVASPVSGGSITYDFTNALAGSKAIIFHSAGAEPTYPVGTYKRFGVYQSSQLNILTFEYIDSNTILLDIAYSTAAGLQPEVVAWMQKGGVATGFMLTALNQFMLDISSIRSRIIRMNLCYGETFASTSIPIIVNTDGSATPTGPALDTMVNYVSGDYTFNGTMGLGGGLYSMNQIKYINTGLDVSTTSEFGQNDCSFGMYINTNIGNNGDVFGMKAGTNIGLYAGTGRSGYINSVGVPVIATGGRIFDMFTRSNSANFDKIYNGVKYTYTAESNAKQSSTMKLGTYGLPGGGFFLTLYGYFVGKSLDSSQEAILRGAWSTLMTKIVR